MAKLRWLGHATFVVEIGGHVVVIDPWITNPLSPYKNLQDFFRDYPDLSLIVVTHDHGDHVGESSELLKHYDRCKFVALYELANSIGEKTGVMNRVVGANIGGPVRLENITLVFTPAAHSASIGDPSGVVMMSGEKSVYHAGDTGLIAEMQFVGELYRPTVALIPIGGHFTMGPLEAAKAVELIKPRYAIPMHYNTFDVIKSDPEEFKRYVKERGVGTEVVVLKPGEEFTF